MNVFYGNRPTGPVQGANIRRFSKLLALWRKSRIGYVCTVLESMDVFCDILFLVFR